MHYHAFDCGAAAAWTGFLIIRYGDQIKNIDKGQKFECKKKTVRKNIIKI